MTALLLIISVSSTILNNSLMNYAGKRKLKTAGDVSRFNFLAYIVCTVIFAIMTIAQGRYSFFSLWFGMLFGIVTALNAACCMLALKNGPMHITLLVTTSSMLIPTFYDVVSGEAPFSWAKFFCTILLIFFIYLSISEGRDKKSKVNGKWLLYCGAAFVLGGLVGVMQKLHQTTAHKDETSLLLAASFVFAMAFSYLTSKRQVKEAHFDKRLIVITLVSGVCVFTMNFLNLRLSGLLPSQLFFPLVNGSSVVACSVLAVTVFREPLSRRKLIGLIGGLAALILICVLP